MDDINQNILETLEGFWDASSLPIGSLAEGTIEELVSPIESITAVEVLAQLDQIVGKKIPISVIRAGGYDSKEHFIDDLSSKVSEFLEQMT
ncbi:MAG: hypothetical protein ABSB19_03110 [Methylomonas sp.]|jgi:hypothetical protein